MTKLTQRCLLTLLPLTLLVGFWLTQRGTRTDTTSLSLDSLQRPAVDAEFAQDNIQLAAPLQSVETAQRQAGRDAAIQLAVAGLISLDDSSPLQENAALQSAAEDFARKRELEEFARKLERSVADAQERAMVALRKEFDERPGESHLIYGEVMQRLQRVPGLRAVPSPAYQQRPQ